MDETWKVIYWILPIPQLPHKKKKKKKKNQGTPFFNLPNYFLIVIMTIEWGL